MIRAAEVIGVLRRNAGVIAFEALINIIAPLVIYDLVKPHHGEVWGLIASSAPPLVWSLIEFARHRRVDAVSILALAGIALSLLAMWGGGSVRLLQLREKLVTALIGAAFLISALIGRPLIYELARASMARKNSPELAEFESRRDRPGFRRTMMLMTLVWGLGLVGEAALAAVLVFLMPIPAYLVAAPVLGYGTIGALTLWTVWFGRRQKARALAAQGVSTP